MTGGRQAGDGQEEGGEAQRGRGPRVGAVRREAAMGGGGPGAGYRRRA